MLFAEFFRHPLRVAGALLVKLAQQVRIDGVRWGTGHLGYLPSLGNDPPHGVATEFESAGDPPNSHALLVEQEHRLTFVRCDHRVA